MDVQNIHAVADWFQVMQTTARSQTAMMILGPGKESGQEPEAHDHSDQVMLVIAGTIQGVVGDELLTLKEGDVIIIPAGMKHRFWNDGEQTATTFNVYAPPEYPPDTRG